MVNRTHKVVRCFEEGRVLNGFRNVYPLIYQCRFVGTVEISFDADVIIKRIAGLKHLDMLFLIDRSLAAERVWKDEQANYLRTPLSDRFLIDGPVMRKFPTHIIPKNRLDAIMKKIRKKAEKSMHKGGSFTLPVTMNDGS